MMKVLPQRNEQKNVVENLMPREENLKTIWKHEKRHLSGQNLMRNEKKYAVNFF